MRELAGAIGAMMVLGVATLLIAATIGSSHSATAATQNYFLSQATTSVATELLKGTAAPTVGTTWTTSIANLPSTVTFIVTAETATSVTVKGTSGTTSFSATATQ